MKSFESIMTHSEEKNTHMNNDNNEKNAEKFNHMEKLPEPVYYVESPDDDTVLVGIDVKIYREEKNNQLFTTVSWHDTNKYRYMMASDTMLHGDCFAFKRQEKEGGGTYYFMPMTIDIYNDKVKKLIIGNPNYTNKEELIDGFLSAAADEF